MKINGTQKVEVEITEKELARTLLQYAVEKYLEKDLDDFGCDWFTKDGKSVYVGGEEWKVIDNCEEFASIVDTFNLMYYGHKLLID